MVSREASLSGFSLAAEVLEEFLGDRSCYLAQPKNLRSRQLGYRGDFNLDHDSHKQERHDLRTEEQFPEIAKPESCSKNRRAMIRGQIKPGTHESTRKP